MGESISNNNRKKGTPKKFIIIAITAILVIGGSVAAFVLLNLSEKQKYFLAEKNNLEAVGDQFNHRFEPELKWQEQTKENPTDTTLELSATYNDPAASLTAFGPAQIINNSTLTIHNAMDTEDKKMATEISAAFGGIEIDGLNFYLTSEKALVELPFLKELLQVKESDIGSLLKKIDPDMYTGEEKMDFDSLFNGGQVISEKDQTYLYDEYLKMLYNEIPDDAFQSSKETVKVDSKSVDAEKITFHLTEKQVKELLSSTMEKMKNDKRLKEIIKEQLAIQTLGAGVSSSNLAPSVEKEIDTMINQFETTLDTAIKELETFQIPDGFTSTIWTKDDLIVKRDFSLSMGPNKDELVAFKVNGTQQFGETNQTFDYTLGFAENDQESSVNITGDLSWKDNKADDSIKLVADDAEFTYEGTSTLKGGERDFERVLSMKTGADEGTLNWSGNATYNEDHMSSENNFAVQAQGVKEDMFSLQLAKDTKLVKQVKIPEVPEVKDIGSMQVNEISQYFQTEVVPQFQQWLLGIMGGGGNLNGF